MKKLYEHLNLLYLISLMPLIIFGLYKNGFNLLIKNSITIFGALKPLLLLFMCIGGTLFSTLIKEIIKRKKLSLKFIETVKKVIIEGILISCILPIRSNPLIVFIIVFMVYLVFKDNKLFNRVALSSIVLFLVNMVLNLNIYENAHERLGNLNLNGVDLFVGNGVGGIYSTSIILILVALFILLKSNIYKKDIVFSSILMYVLLVGGYMMIMGTYGKIFITLFSYNTIFIFTFIAPILESSSYTIKGQKVSGILIAIITFIFLLVDMPYIGALVGIIFVGIIKQILDRAFTIK